MGFLVTWREAFFDTDTGGGNTVPRGAPRRGRDNVVYVDVEKSRG